MFMAAISITLAMAVERNRTRGIVFCFAVVSPVSERSSKKAAAAAKEKTRFVLLRGIARGEFALFLFCSGLSSTGEY